MISAPSVDKAAGSFKTLGSLSLLLSPNKWLLSWGEKLSGTIDPFEKLPVSPPL